MPTRAEIDEGMEEAPAQLALGDHELLSKALGMRADLQEESGLDPHVFGLVKFAALVALDAPPPSYLWQVANALDSGATPQDLIGVLRQVGLPKVVAAAPELTVALGLPLPDGA